MKLGQKNSLKTNITSTQYFKNSEIVSKEGVIKALFMPEYTLTNIFQIGAKRTFYAEPSFSQIVLGQSGSSSNVNLANEDVV